MLGVGIGISLSLVQNLASGPPVERSGCLLLESGGNLLLENNGRFFIDTFTPLYFSTRLKFFDLTALNKLFQDSAATSPVTAVNQPIGKIVDQSGSANHALQSTDSYRPLVKKDSDNRYYIYFDRADDALDIASLASGQYTTAIATWSDCQIQTATQKTTGSYSLNPSDTYARVIVSGALTDNERANLTSWLNTKRPTTGITDILRFYSNTNSVSLSVTESGSSGSTWELGDGQTASGTSCVKTISAPQTIIWRATSPQNITSFNWNTKSLYGQLDFSKLTGLISVYISHNKFSGMLDLTNNPFLSVIYGAFNYFCGDLNIKNNTVLTTVQLSGNDFTGQLSLSANTSLTTLDLSYNSFDSFDTDAEEFSIPSTLGDCNLSYNQFDQSNIDSILWCFVSAGKETGTRVLNLGGAGNEAPSSSGLEAVSILQGMGWTVTHN